MLIVFELSMYAVFNWIFTVLEPLRIEKLKLLSRPTYCYYCERYIFVNINNLY